MASGSLFRKDWPTIKKRTALSFQYTPLNTSDREIEACA